MSLAGGQYFPVCREGCGQERLTATALPSRKPIKNGYSGLKR